MVCGWVDAEDYESRVHNTSHPHTCSRNQLYFMVAVAGVSRSLSPGPALGICGWWVGLARPLIPDPWR